MAKTFTELEASDIDTTNNPMHKSVMIGVLVASLIMTTKSKPGEDEAEAAKRKINECVATFLNSLERDNYIITKREDIPSAFLNA